MNLVHYYKMNVLPGTKDVNGRMREAESFEETHKKLLENFTIDGNLSIPICNSKVSFDIQKDCTLIPMLDIVGYIVEYTEKTHTYGVRFLDSVGPFPETKYKVACVTLANIDNDNNGEVYKTERIVAFHFICERPDKEDDSNLETVTEVVKKKGE